MAWAPDYCTVAELKDLLRIDVSDTEDDVLLGLAITAASRAIDRATERQFGNSGTAQARYYTAWWDRETCLWVVDIDDVQNNAGLTVSYDSADDGGYADTITGYRLGPRNAAADGKPWTRLLVARGSAVRPGTVVDGVRVDAIFGWDLVPETIREACLLQANRVQARRDSPFGIAGSPENGSELRLLARVDPDVALMVKPYRRMWGAA